MRKGFIVSVFSLLASAGLAVAQPSADPMPPEPGQSETLPFAPRPLSPLPSGPSPSAKTPAAAAPASPLPSNPVPFEGQPSASLPSEGHPSDPMTSHGGEVIEGSPNGCTSCGHGSAFGNESADCSLLWFRADYLLWWTKDSPVPVPLVTQGNRADAVPGAIGQPGTRVLIGNEDLDHGERHGGRFALGIWLDDEGTIGVEGTYFFLSTRTASRSASSSGLPGSPLLAFPFFDVTTGAENAVAVANAGAALPFAGTARLSISSQLQGSEVNGLFNLFAEEGLRLDLIGGFRHLYLHEGLAFDTSSPNVPTIPGEVFRTHDQFDGYNHFYGAQLGARATYSQDGLSVAVTGKLALGDMHEIVNISGTNVTNDFIGRAGTPQTFRGGLLAQGTNIGRHTRDEFAVIPEVDLNVSYEVTSWAKVSVGYSFLYVSDVVRPGDQLNRNINPTQSTAITFTPTAALVGAARPEFNFNSSDYWAQGINFGVELSW